MVQMASTWSSMILRTFSHGFVIEILKVEGQSLVFFQIQA